MAASLAELLYDIASGALRQQEREVMELRGRTQALLMAAALVASFFGAGEIDRDGMGPAAVVAICALVLTLVACMHVLSPLAAVFALDARAVHRALYNDNDDDIRSVHTKVVYMLNAARAGNVGLIRRMSRAFRLGLLGLVVQIVVWGLALALD